MLLHQVSQKYMVAPLDLQFSILYDVLKKHVAEDADYKVSYLSTELQSCILKMYYLFLTHLFAGDYILYDRNGHKTGC